MRKVTHLSSGLTDYTRCQKLAKIGRNEPLSVTTEHREVTCIKCMNRLLFGTSPVDAEGFRDYREIIVAQLVKDARKARE